MQKKILAVAVALAIPQMNACSRLHTLSENREKLDVELISNDEECRINMSIDFEVAQDDDGVEITSPLKGDD